VPDPFHIVLEVEPDSEPVTGTVLATGQPARRVCGWTDLFAALRSAVEVSQDGTPAAAVLPAVDGD
jgi:hypothetical protein